MSTLLLQNAILIEDNRKIKADVYIRAGRIEKIASDLSSMKVPQVLDLRGKYLLPGMIDCHVQFPDGYYVNECDGTGLDHGKGDLHTESRAAVAGGITSFFCSSSSVSNCTSIINSDRLDEKMKLASEKSVANYSFYLSATNDNLEEVKLVDPKSCCGVKISMGGTRGELLVDDEKNLNPIFENSPTIVVCHCEDTPTIVENEESYRQIHGDNIPMLLHPKIRSDEACYISSSLAVKLSNKYQQRLHILHISSAKEIELLSDLVTKEKLISSSVASQHLNFTEEDYAEKGGLIKCDPAIKTEIDRAGLFQGLIDDHLDCICSDHVFCTEPQKQGNYFEVISGMPNVQYGLLSLLEHCHDGILSLQNVVDKTSHSVSDAFQIKDRGYIKEGYWADLVVVDFAKGMTVNKENIVSKAGWTPYEGVEFRSSIYATIINGNLVYINNKVRSGTYGKQIEFSR